MACQKQIETPASIINYLGIGTCNLRSNFLNLSIFAIASICLYMYWTLPPETESHPHYFLTADDVTRLEYAVATNGCHIVKMDPFDLSISHFLKTDRTILNCFEKHKHWTFINGSKLVFNYSAIAENGVALHSFRCCYNIITRINYPIHQVDLDNNDDFRISDDCNVLNNQKPNPVSAEAIKVICTYADWPLIGETIYKNFHTLTQPFKNANTRRKIDKWKSESQRPPNVLILGIDTMSKSNFARTMPRTKKYLIDIGAYEMIGHTKVGENTFPNMLPAMSGYSEEELRNICIFSNLTPQDECPYVWKLFDKAGYLTADVEDRPSQNMFNYMKVGFAKQPMDFYMRPIMRYAYTLKYYNCITGETVEQRILNYAEDLLKMGNDVQSPIFLLTWLTEMSHDDMNVARYSDDVYENFLRKIDLNNTILYFISDHGVRYGAFRHTFSGYLEDKLPNFWIYLSPNIQKKYPAWVKNLRMNTGRLTTNYDFYNTMIHGLQEFSKIDPFPNSVDQNGSVVNRKYGQSFFQPISDTRTCNDTGIPTNNCPCNVPIQADHNSQEVILAAKASVEFINSQLPPYCSPFKFQNITAAGSRKVYQKHSDTVEEFILAFIVIPGEFLFETSVKYDSGTKTFVVHKDVLRMNKITADGDCGKTPEEQRMCYCKN